MDASLQQEIYQELVNLVKARLDDRFTVSEAPGRFNVDTNKAVVIEGRKRPFVNLLSVIIQKHHIGFYFMPVYADTALRESLSDSLSSMLKGKSCFHCKTEFSPELKAELDTIVVKGIDLYRANGWID